jgi:CHASE1-domain containing sensor protein
MAMPWTVAWIIAVIVGLIGLTIGLVANAMALRRDLNQRRDVFRARLEDTANALVEDLLKASNGDRGQSESSRP